MSELEGQVSKLVEVVREAEGSEERLADECRQCREQLKALDVAQRREVEEMTTKHQQVGQWYAVCIWFPMSC